MKTTTITLAILLITSLGFSQGFHIGAKAGANFANQKGDEDQFLKGRTAFHLGAIGEIMFTDALGLQIELLYNQLGAKYEERYDEDFYEGIDESTIKDDYLSLPVMAKYYIVKGLSLEAGPQISYLLSSKQEGTIVENGHSEDYSYDLKKENYRKSLNIGLGIGASYKLDFGLFFSMRYVAGLSNINEDTITETYGEFEYTEKLNKRKNNAFQVSIGYFFN
ncbi:MAG: PorT family protein [Flavobacteriaceae bacterium]|nr:PorT family protein [Flavobacteriaceae bacterium]